VQADAKNLLLTQKSSGLNQGCQGASGLLHSYRPIALATMELEFISNQDKLFQHT
jgi:hypothetical protein